MMALTNPTIENPLIISRLTIDGESKTKPMHIPIAVDMSHIKLNINDLYFSIRI